MTTSPRWLAILGIGALVALPQSALSDDDKVTSVEEIEVRDFDDEDFVESDEIGEAGEASDQESVVVRREETSEKSAGLDDQVVGIQLQGGFVNLDDTLGDGNARAVVGLSFDANILSGVDTESGKPFLGPAIGAFYSHLGQPGSNFFGLNAPSGDDGADLALFPVNLKAGYTFGEAVRLSGHGGVTFDYQNSRGASLAGFEDENWDVRPNFGGDLEFGLGDRVSLLIRADWTLRGQGSTPFTGTLGIGFPLS